MTMTRWAIKGFDLDEHFPEVEKEGIDFNDGTDLYYFKRKVIADGLILHLSEEGQASLDYNGEEIGAFLWDDELADMFDNINYVSVIELFKAMRDRRLIA